MRNQTVQSERRRVVEHPVFHGLDRRFTGPHPAPGGEPVPQGLGQRQADAVRRIHAVVRPVGSGRAVAQFAHAVAARRIKAGAPAGLRTAQLMSRHIQIFLDDLESAVVGKRILNGLTDVHRAGTGLGRLRTRRRGCRLGRRRCRNRRRCAERQHCRHENHRKSLTVHIVPPEGCPPVMQFRTLSPPCLPDCPDGGEVSRPQGIPKYPWLCFHVLPRCLPVERRAVCPVEPAAAEDPCVLRITPECKKRNATSIRLFSFNKNMLYEKLAEFYLMDQPMSTVQRPDPVFFPFRTKKSSRTELDREDRHFTPSENGSGLPAAGPHPGRIAPFPRPVQALPPGLQSGGQCTEKKQLCTAVLRNSTLPTGDVVHPMGEKSPFHGIRFRRPRPLPHGCPPCRARNGRKKEGIRGAGGTMNRRPARRQRRAGGDSGEGHAGAAWGNPDRKRAPERWLCAFACAPAEPGLFRSQRRRQPSGVKKRALPFRRGPVL